MDGTPTRGSCAATEVAAESASKATSKSKSHAKSRSKTKAAVVEAPVVAEILAETAVEAEVEAAVAVEEVPELMEAVVLAEVENAVSEVQASTENLCECEAHVASTADLQARMEKPMLAQAKKPVITLPQTTSKCEMSRSVHFH